MYINNDKLVNFKELYLGEFNHILILDLIERNNKKYYIVLSSYLRLSIIDENKMIQMLEDDYFNGADVQIGVIFDTGNIKDNSHEIIEKYNNQRYIVLSNTERDFLALDLQDNTLVKFNRYEVTTNIKNYFNIEFNKNNMIEVKYQMYNGEFTYTYDEVIERYNITKNFMLKQSILCTTEMIIFLEIHEGRIKLVDYKGRDYDIIVPDIVDIINEKAFTFNKYIRTIKLGKNTTTIDYKAFYACEKLHTVKVSKKFRYIGASAFLFCPLLKSINLGTNRIMNIEDAFDKDCKIIRQPID